MSVINFTNSLSAKEVADHYGDDGLIEDLNSDGVYEIEIGSRGEIEGIKLVSNSPEVCIGTDPEEYYESDELDESLEWFYAEWNLEGSIFGVSLYEEYGLEYVNVRG